MTERIDLDQIERDAEQATPGPWRWVNTDDWFLESASKIDTEYDEYGSVFCRYPSVVLMCDPTDSYGKVNADATHIANCDPDTIKAHVTAVRAAYAVDFAYEHFERTCRHHGSWSRQAESSLAELRVDLGKLHDTLAPFRQEPTE